MLPSAFIFVSLSLFSLINLFLSPSTSSLLYPCINIPLTPLFSPPPCRFSVGSSIACTRVVRSQSRRFWRHRWPLSRWRRSPSSCRQQRSTESSPQTSSRPWTCGKVGCTFTDTYHVSIHPCDIDMHVQLRGLSQSCLC